MALVHDFKTHSEFKRINCGPTALARNNHKPGKAGQIRHSQARCSRCPHRVNPTVRQPFRWLRSPRSEASFAFSFFPADLHYLRLPSKGVPFQYGDMGKPALRAGFTLRCAMIFDDRLELCHTLAAGRTYDFCLQEFSFMKTIG